MAGDVTTLHPDYVEAAPEWTQQRDCMKGQRRIKARGVTYLRKSGAQALAEQQLATLGVPEASGPYQIAKSMARFPEMLEAAVTGFTGIGTRIPWQIEALPAAMSYLVVTWSTSGSAYSTRSASGYWVGCVPSPTQSIEAATSKKFGHSQPLGWQPSAAIAMMATSAMTVMRRGRITGRSSPFSVECRPCNQSTGTPTEPT